MSLNKVYFNSATLITPTPFLGYFFRKMSIISLAATKELNSL